MFHWSTCTSSSWLQLIQFDESDSSTHPSLKLIMCDQWRTPMFVRRDKKQILGFIQAWSSQYLGWFVRMVLLFSCWTHLEVQFAFFWCILSVFPASFAKNIIELWARSSINQWFAKLFAIIWNNCNVTHPINHSTVSRRYSGSLSSLKSWWSWWWQRNNFTSSAAGGVVAGNCSHCIHYHQLISHCSTNFSIIKQSTQHTLCSITSVPSFEFWRVFLWVFVSNFELLK